MSEPESNICAACGGVKRIEYVIVFEEGVPREMRINRDELPETAWRLCPGHPEPAQKHDGQIGLSRFGGKPLSVELFTLSYSKKQLVSLKTAETRLVNLAPAEALSLLDWLLQERGELTRLAKEQGE